MVEAPLVKQFLDIIVSEAGVDYEELCDDSEFSGLGIDTLLAKTIVNRVFETSKVALSYTIFQTYNTVGNLKEHLATIVTSSQSPPLIRSISAPASVPVPLSLIIRLQGSPRGASRNIFLLPDGSGFGMAYARIPPLGPEVCLYGLNSPFLKNCAGNSFGRKLEDLAHLWIPEIRKVQPQGPYILGGWSAGGYYAFEVAKQLICEGETVEKLILIDSPCRLVFEALPMEVVRHLSGNNLMGNWSTKETPQWLVNHFDATIKAVDSYMPTPIHTFGTTKVLILWASEGVLPAGGAEKTGLDLSVKVTRFLLQHRPDFGPLGWEKLFPGGKIEIAKMPGNHFNLVHDPNVSTHTWQTLSWLILVSFANSPGCSRLHFLEP